MNKQQLAAKIWESANKMRSKIEANEYKDYILGFIFYKFLSETELKFCRENDFTQADIEILSEDDPETLEYIKQNIGYFISYHSLFSTWLKLGKDFTVDDVRVALSAFNRNVNDAHKKVFEGIFETLETGLSKLGDTTSSQTKAIRDLLDTIKDIPMDGRQNYDVLGFIYEYLISNFAANAGKKAGEFYTPHEVSQLISEIVVNHLDGKKQISIYDPTSGSGSLLINIGKAVSSRVGASDGIKYYAQELKENTYNLTRMNLVMRGILPSNITVRNGDTLEDDWPYFDEADPQATYTPLYVDAVVSNPPYSQRWDPTDKDVDPRYAYGLAPKSKADYAFLLHDLYHLRPEGIMCIILPHGVLFRGGEEGQIRRNLLENHHIQAIIGLPANIFFGTGIPTIIMVLRQKRVESDVLIVDASKGFEKEGKNNKLRACDIKRIVDAVVSRTTIDKFSRLVELDEIRANDYNLNIPRYVDSSQCAESWDIYAGMFGGIPATEIDELNVYWSAWPSLKAQLFTGKGDYLYPATDAVRKVIATNNDVVRYCENFDAKLEPFSHWLDRLLVKNPCDVDTAHIEATVANRLFDTLGGVQLIDLYEAYQILSEVWNLSVSIDLEILQSEGLNAVRQVDPNMVIKKKNGADHEVQEGWVGHIIPFDLVQKTILSRETDALYSLENELAACESEIEQSIEYLTDEEKDIVSDALNEDGTAWIPSMLNKVSKLLAEEAKSESDFEMIAQKTMSVQRLFSHKKELKSQIKTDSANLLALTKKTIEQLDDLQVEDLLRAKWVEPVIDGVGAIPSKLIDDLASRVQALYQKYSTTFADVSGQIVKVEQELSTMIDNLCGSDYDLAGLAEFQKLLGGE